MSVKHLLTTFLAGGLFVCVFMPVDAKVLPRHNPAAAAKKLAAPSKNAKSYVSAKLRPDRKALNVTFMNLTDVKSLDYILTYTGSGADQGVTGSVDTSAGSTATRELVFGTSSAGVYKYHTNITKMRFEVTIKLKTGKTIVKKYTVKP